MTQFKSNIKLTRNRQCLLLADVEVSAGGRHRLLAEQFPDDFDITGLLVDISRLRPPLRHAHGLHTIERGASLPRCRRRSVTATSRQRQARLGCGSILRRSRFSWLRVRLQNAADNGASELLGHTTMAGVVHVQVVGCEKEAFTVLAR